MHAAKLKSSDRLQRTLAALRQAGADGLTTDGVRRITGSVCVHSDVAESPAVAPVPAIEEEHVGQLVPIADCLRAMREAVR